MHTVQHIKFASGEKKTKCNIQFWWFCLCIETPTIANIGWWLSGVCKMNICVCDVGLKANDNSITTTATLPTHLNEQHSNVNDVRMNGKKIVVESECSKWCERVIYVRIYTAIARVYCALQET